MSDFEIKTKQAINYIDDCITQIAKFSKTAKSMKTFNEKRMYSALIACSAIEKAQNLYLIEAESKINYNRNQVINYDYTVSQYANRLYAITSNLVSQYKNSKIDDIKDVSMQDVATLVNYNRKMLYIAARWSTQRLIEIYDLDKPEKNKKLPKRLPILSDALACFDNILCTKLGVKTESNIHLKRLVICMPPSSGKTYAANAYTVLTLCHHHIRFAETGIIRMTNNMDNAKIYGSQVHNMMTDPVFVNVFPEYRKYITADNKNKLFSYESAEQYLLRDCSNECFNSIFMFGWDSGINGKRSLLGSVLDDISDGTNTMDSDDFHKKQTAKVMTDVTDRNDSDDCPIIIMGTMYNENDVQNTFIDMWERNLEPHPYLRNVQVTKDGTCGVCLIDIENESGNSIAPELYPDSLLQSKKEFCARTGKMYMYNLIYRQKRDSREPKTFALNTLKQYTSLPKTLSKTSKSFIDTTRKNGSDYFAQPFCYYDEENNLWYLVDCIFEQKSLGIISDPKNKFKEKVCNKIIANNTTQCGIESNTSNTTGALLKDRLTQLGYTDCRFIEKYTYGKKGQSKFTRILDMEEAIKEHIVFPSPLYGMSNEMQRFMEQLTGWNSKGKQGRANPDDAIDSIALFAKTFIQEKKLKVEINSNLKMSDIFG